MKKLTKNLIKYTMGGINKMALEAGEKYLSIKMAGHDYVVAFKNKTKEGEQPDYKGDGIAVWVREKQAKVEAEKVGV